MTERLVADAAAMAELGAALAHCVRPPAVIALEGPLGAGKTTLVRAILRGLGYRGAVRSPTYTLIESYEFGAWVVHHLDLYRLGDPEELEFLGVRDLATDNAIWLVEWPGRGGDRLPPIDRTIRIEYADSGRRVSGLPPGVASPC